MVYGYALSHQNAFFFTRQFENILPIRSVPHIPPPPPPPTVWSTTTPLLEVLICARSLVVWWFITSTTSYASSNLFAITALSLVYINRIGDAMDSVFVSSAVDRGFEPRLVQSRDYEIGIC